MPVSNLNEILSNELSNAQEKDKWLIKLLYYLHYIEGKNISWCDCGICGGIIANYLGIAVARELGFEINIKKYEQKTEGLPYGLDSHPLESSLRKLDPSLRESAIDYIKDSLGSLSKEIKEPSKLFIEKIEWDINHYRSSRK